MRAARQSGRRMRRVGPVHREAFAAAALRRALAAGRRWLVSREDVAWSARTLQHLAESQIVRAGITPELQVVRLRSGQANRPEGQPRRDRPRRQFQRDSPEATYWTSDPPANGAVLRSRPQGERRDHR